MVAKNPYPEAKAVVIASVVNPKGAPLSTPLEGHQDGHEKCELNFVES